MVLLLPRCMRVRWMLLPGLELLGWLQQQFHLWQRRLLYM